MDTSPAGEVPRNDVGGGSNSDNSYSDEEGAPVLGVLPNGRTFTIPPTISVVSALLLPSSWLCPATALWILCGLITTSTLPLYGVGAISYSFLVVQFVLWRLAYNVGLGVLLRWQSNSQGVLRSYNDMLKRNPKLGRWITTIVGYHATNQSSYDPDAYPPEFNAWLCFRFVVNIVLANDLTSYLVLVAASWDPIVPTSGVDVARYAVALCLDVFAVWSKADAHRVIGDYAWYWGDFYFKMDRELVFDGVFTMVPHPMYTVGYSFMYGCAIMTKSYVVFFVSIFGHVLQLMFLAVVENPHIDKTYRALSEPTEEERQREALLYDEQEGFFERKELIVIKNLTLRSADIIHVVLMGYVVVLAYFMGHSSTAHVLHCLGWRVFHTVSMGWILHQQSTHRRWTTHFGSSREAFDHWKRLYNTSVTIANLTFLLCSVFLFQWDSPLAPSESLRWVTITLGSVLIAINVYVSLEVYETLGDFGFFYGDFFIDGVPHVLNYSGIYRYLNNPESSVGYCGYYGAALIAGSPAVLVLAGISQLCSKLFDRVVERPHMQRKYGRGQLRRHGGLSSGLLRQGDDIRRALTEKRTAYELALRQFRVAVEKSREYDVRKEAVERLRRLRKPKSH